MIVQAKQRVQRVKLLLDDRRGSAFKLSLFFYFSESRMNKGIRLF